MNPILSVIIPCYNCASVITRCLDSIDYPNAEIIIVNDGSTDQSKEVVEQYIETHSDARHIRLFNKSNGGVSSARNVGIRESTGKYLCCVDADDYLMEDGLKRMVVLAEQEHADVVLYTANYTNEENLIPQRSVKDDTISTEIFKTGKEILTRYDIADYYVWDAIYSRKLIVDNNIIFPEDVCLHEDDVFKGEIYSCSLKVIVTDLPLYCYVRSSSQSSTHNQSIQRQRVLIESCWRAVAYRKRYITERCPSVMPMERFKYMRYVIPPKVAKKAHLSLIEYKKILEKFRELDVYPLDYKWIEIAHWYAPLYQKLKYVVKTFLTNHPNFAYLF